MNMYQLLERTAQTWPDNLFLVREGVSYKDFINLVKARAASLDKVGVKKGDVVGILSHNIPEFPITLFALWYLGATVLLLDTNLTPFEYDNMATTTNCKNDRSVFQILLLGTLSMDSVFSVTLLM